MKKIYLASPFFSEDELKIYKEVISILRKHENVEVFVPMEHEIPNAFDVPNAKWGYEVFNIDKEAIDNSDIVIVLNFGMYSDSGTAWEAGYAFAKGKDVYHVLCGNGEYSLMMINGTGKIITLDDFRKGIIPNQDATLNTIIQK